LTVAVQLLRDHTVGRIGKRCAAAKASRRELERQK
jgi:hypothetical protein